MIQSNFVSIIDNLKADKVISEELSKLIKSSGNINKQDGFGRSAIHFACAKGNKKHLHQLIVNGANIDLRIIDGSSAFSAAAAYNTKDMVEFMLSMPKNKIMDEVILAQNAFKQNALILAANHNNTEVVRSLLADPRGNIMLPQQDIFGRTAFDYAVSHGNKDIIRILLKDGKITDKAIEAFPRYREAFVDINQINLYTKLSAYLTQNNRDPNLVLNKEGNCNGFSFLYQAFLTSGNIKEYHEILAVIANFNKENQEEELPPLLKNKYIDKKLLFETIISSLALFQFTSPVTRDLSFYKESQISRPYFYELAKDLKLNRTLRPALEFSKLTMNRAQLVEWLEMSKQWPKKSFFIAGAKHMTTFYVTPEGTFQYYDPNLKGKTVVRDAATLATYILQKQFEVPYANLNTQSITIDSFCAYQFYAKNELIPKVERTVFSRLPLVSANNFSVLHYAVLSNDIKKIKEVIESTEKDKLADLMNQKDAHGHTALKWAVTMENIDVIDYLQSIYTTHRISSQLSRVALIINKNSIEKHHPMFLEEVFKKGWLDYNGLDSERNKIYHTFIYKSEYVSGMILAKIGAEINQQNKYGNTPLHYAITQATPKVIQKFVNYPNIDVNIKNKLGKTVLMTALQNNVSVDLIQELFKAKDLELNSRSLAGNSALEIALKNNIHPETLRCLIKDERLLINQKNAEGETPLMFAIKNNVKPSLIAVLLTNKDIDINLYNQKKSALHYALDPKADVATLQLLLKDFRLDINKKNKKKIHDFRSLNLTQEQLIPLLEYFSLYPGVLIALEPPKQIPLIEILPQGHFRYYNGDSLTKFQNYHSAPLLAKELLKNYVDGDSKSSAEGRMLANFEVSYYTKEKALSKVVPTKIDISDKSLQAMKKLCLCKVENPLLVKHLILREWRNAFQQFPLIDHKKQTAMVHYLVYDLLESDQENIDQLIFTEEVSNTPLMLAIKYKMPIECIQSLVQITNVTKPNPLGKTALDFAMETSDPTCLQIVKAEICRRDKIQSEIKEFLEPSFHQLQLSSNLQSNTKSRVLTERHLTKPSTKIMVGKTLTTTYSQRRAERLKNVCQKSINKIPSPKKQEPNLLFWGTKINL